MTQTAELPWGEWLPSAPTWKNPGCVVAENVIPAPGMAYRPTLTPRKISDDITGLNRGAATFYTIGGEPVTVGGAPTALFVVKGGAETLTGSLTDIGDANYWDFCQFNDLIIAASANNNIKYLDDIDTDTSWSDLTGTPPRALYCARVNNFVMLGNISTQPNRIQWSSVNNPSGAWAVDRLTQAGFRDLPRAFGGVQRIVGGRYGLAFQERGVLRLDYVGPPQVFRATEISTGRGCIAPFSVIQVEAITYFLAQDGFFATDGSSFERIGSNRINSWFFDEVNQDRVARTHAAVDWRNECVVWAFSSVNAARFDRLLFYSWAQNRWSYAKVDVGWLVDNKVSGLTVEQLGSLYSTTDDVPGGIDDAAWKAKANVLSAMVNGATTQALHYFDGAALEARLESGQFQPQTGQRVLVTELRPIAEGDMSGATMAAIGADNATGEQYGAFTSPGAAGFCPVRVDGRAIRAALTIPAGASWRAAQGYQARFRASGRR